MWETVLVITLLNLLSTILYILSSFGNAIFLQLGWQICATCNMIICSGQVSEAVFYISISSLISSPLQVYSMWKSINWPIAINLTISQLCGGFIGISLLFIVTSVWMVRCLGILFGFVAIQYILKECVEIVKKRIKAISPPPPVSADLEEKHVCNDIPEDQKDNVTVSPFSTITSSQESKGLSTSSVPTDVIPQQQSSRSNSRLTLRSGLLVWAVGLSAGLLGGLFGTPGPPLMIYVTRSSMTKDEVRGTIAVSYVFLTIERLLMISLLPNSTVHVFSTSSLYAVIGIFCSSITGRYIGNFLSKYVDEVLFRRIIMGILSFGSITMMTSGIDLIYRLVAYVVIMSFYGLIGYLTYLYQMRKSAADHDTSPSLWKYYRIMSKSQQLGHLPSSSSQYHSHTSEIQLTNKQTNWRNLHNFGQPNSASYEYFDEQDMSSPQQRNEA